MFSSLGKHLGDRDTDVHVPKFYFQIALLQKKKVCNIHDIKNEQKCLDLLTFVLELRERHFEQHIPTRSESQMLNTVCENDWRYYFYF